MYQLVYASSATVEMTDDDLLELLHTSRLRNSSKSVTGMLLYADGNFIQVLEGEQVDVEEIYASIERDPRNTGHLVLLSQEVQGRSFADWSMGFQNLTPNQYRKIEGYSGFLEKNLDLPKGKNLIPPAVKLLFSFKSQQILNGRNQTLAS